MTSLYLHIPFCKQACHYCDFHFSTQRSRQGEMVEAMIRELEIRREEAGENVVQTIYFGGGTPSLLTDDELGRLLDTISRTYSMTSDPEITLEANPDDLNEAKLRSLKEAGINRLSIGIQSFIERDLRLMNRAHSAREALSCLETASQYFSNISADLIYGIPGQTAEEWGDNLTRLLDSGIPHISCYALTVEPGTALQHLIRRKVISPVEDDAAEERFSEMVPILTGAGFVHYELSNFGKPGYFSRNNLAYWQGSNYIGIGPSAHSFDGSRRSWNTRNNPKYLKALQQHVLPSSGETLTIADRYNESVMTGLRTMWGVDTEMIRTEFGMPYYEYLLQQAEKHLKAGLLEWKEPHLRVTRKGTFLSDGLAADLFQVNEEPPAL